MTENSDTAIFETFNDALARAKRSDAPYRHWLISDLLPQDVLRDLQRLKFPVLSLNGVSGKREFHNDSRHYFDQTNIAKHPVAAAIANAFQQKAMTNAIERFFSADLNDTFLRLEYAQDVTGFWLQPHTDLGVKRITILIYLSDGVGHENLGTDIYNTDKKWIARTPFAPNAAMAFVPGDNTFHGFEEREIQGVRKSLILNYVTADWRDREQLAFPDTLIKQ